VSSLHENTKRESKHIAFNDLVINRLKFIDRLYLDYSYQDIPLERAYDFNPIPKNLEEQYHNRIIGTGCQMWGEWIPNSGSMDYMIFPRIAAYAEVGWTQRKHKDFERFLKSLSGLINTWKTEGIFYAPLKEALPATKQDN